MWIARLVLIALCLVACRAEEPGVLETAVKFLGQCGNKEITACIKERALRALDAAKDVEITEGITLKKDATVENMMVSEPLPEEGRSLPENAIDDLLIDRAANFLTSHTLEFKIPKNTADEMKRSLEEARKKKKKAKKLLLPLLLLLKLKAAILLPIIFGAIAFIAFKALIIGKIALVISLIAAVKKLLLGKGKDNHEGFDIVAHPQISHGHVGGYDDHHGHFARSIDDPQNLAYSAYAGKQ